VEGRANGVEEEEGEGKEPEDVDEDDEGESCKGDKTKGKVMIKGWIFVTVTAVMKREISRDKGGRGEGNRL